MFLRTTLKLGLFTLAFATITPAFAQPSPAEIEASKKVAAENANKAFDAYEAGKYEDAISGFKKAEAAFHAPKFLLYIARAQMKLGKVAEARATYESILAEQLPPYAPSEFFSAQASARKELAELPKTSTPNGESPGPNSGASVTAGSSASPTTTAPATGSAASSSQAPGEKGDKASSGKIPTGTYVSYGVGAVGLIAGAVFGGLTLAKKGDYDAARGTQPVDASAVNQAAGDGKTFAIVSDVGFLVAIAGAAVGTVIWIVAPSKQTASASGGPGKSGGSSARVLSVGAVGASPSGASSDAASPAHKGGQASLYASPAPFGMVMGGSF